MLLKIEPEHDVAVIEMGMSHAGEIRALAKIAQPEIGVVTNVAPVHLEFFDSLASIARAKYEFVESLPANGTAVLNADDEYVSQFGRDFKGKVIRYGTCTTADVRAENIESLGAEGSRFDVVTSNGRERAQSAASRRAQRFERFGSGVRRPSARDEVCRRGRRARDSFSCGQARTGSQTG